ncbi:MAG TPA: hypothetical protein VL198_11610 [Pseudolabrys sp.]|jgi:hypothetical protein|nr:hypothetical protein [Pseudolabrys sp.]
MAYVPYTSATRDFVTDKPEPNRAGFFRRLINAIFVSRQRQVEREIARYLQNGRFTDEVEREIERRFFR